MKKFVFVHVELRRNKCLSTALYLRRYIGLIYARSENGGKFMGDVRLRNGSMYVVDTHGTKLASFREAVDVPSHPPLAIVSSERPLPRITNAKCFLRYPEDTPRKLKQSNIARFQYATR